MTAKTAKPFALFEAGAKFDAVLKDIRTKGAALDALIHQAAVSAIAIAARQGGTGNGHYVNALYLAMPKGSRHAALTAWILEFSDMTANEAADKDTKPFVHVKGDGRAVDLEKAKANPWYNFKPSPKPDEVMDVFALTRKLIEKAKKKAAKDSEGVKGLEFVGELEAILAKHSEETGVDESILPV